MIAVRTRDDRVDFPEKSDLKYNGFGHMMELQQLIRTAVVTGRMP
jgi:hypothetical protein